MQNPRRRNHEHNHPEQSQCRCKIRIAITVHIPRRERHPRHRGQQEWQQECDVTREQQQNIRHPRANLTAPVVRDANNRRRTGEAEILRRPGQQAHQQKHDNRHQPDNDHVSGQALPPRRWNLRLVLDCRSPCFRNSRLCHCAELP